MRIGLLNKRITIESEASAPDQFGQMIPTWSTFRTCWAAISPLKGDEKFTADQLLATVTHSIRIRYASGISPQMRVKYNGRIFAVNAVLNENERNKVLTLLVTEDA